jgi:hypothetical protein
MHIHMQLKDKKKFKDRTSKVEKSNTESTNMAMSGICFDIHLNFPIRLLFNQLACLSRAATAHVRQTRSLCTPRKKNLSILSFDGDQTDFVQNPMDKACIISPLKLCGRRHGLWFNQQSEAYGLPNSMDGKEFQQV